MTAPSALSVQQLSTGYGDRRVLEAVDLEVKPGELWAVLGPNGAGKSTLVRASLGLLPARAGKVAVLGRDVRGLGRRELARKVAWVPQSVDALPDFTAMELVLMGRAPHLSRWALASGSDVARAKAALEELGIGPLAGRALGALSGGERRLVMLARALTQAPELLFLDEPTAFLDVRHQVQTLALVRRRVEAGMAAVAVLHDVNLAAAFATKALLLGGGRVLGSGDAGEVLAAGRLEALYGVSIATATSAAGQRLFGPATG
ncbi:MAG TPA: ABC transporter ATP-binding protein [Myxococcaceae bacterium]|nr:ABC transporter ATP-binding protein [Myxococcaceae bacterium]